MEIRKALIPGEVPALRELFEEYAGSLGIPLDFQGFDGEVADLPGRYAAPRGGLWMAIAGGRAAGCVALRPLGADLCEIKRLYLRPEFRGTGLGRRLAETVLAEAARIGYRRVWLDTLPSMGGAIALYRSLGFTEIEPYYDNPVPGALFLGREVDSGESGGTG
jgi:ribosomal protein S18 acetylase RimI-like enzyme